MEKNYISVIIPVYNEQENIPFLYKSLKPELSVIKEKYEIIFIDDGSEDNTFSTLCELQRNDHSIRIVKLSRNHGHQIALSAGLDHASGTFAITMDADLQHPPELIHKFLEEAFKGYDIVSGVKIKTESRGCIKNVFSTVYYWLFQKITKISVEPNASDFRLYSKKALSVIVKMRERERYLRGMAEWTGFKHNKIYYNCPPRHAGKPKYTISKLFKLASYGIFSFSSFPVRISTYIGFLILSVTFIFTLVFLTKYLFSHSPMNTNGIIHVLIFFILGWLLIALGIMGEYLIRVYEEVKGRPLYIIDSKIGFD